MDKVYAGNTGWQTGRASEEYVDLPLDFSIPYPESSGGLINEALVTAGLGALEEDVMVGYAGLSLGCNGKCRGVGAAPRTWQNPMGLSGIDGEVGAWEYYHGNLGDTPLNVTLPADFSSAGFDANTLSRLYTTSVNQQSVTNSSMMSILSPSIETIQARIQAQVGQFLALKSLIMTMMNDPKIQTTDKAVLQQLYDSQVGLEVGLQNNLVLIQSIQSGQRSAVSMVNDITNLGIFATQIELQMNSVSEFATKYGYSAGISSGGSLFGLSVPVILVGGALIFGFFYSRRVSRVRR